MTFPLWTPFTNEWIAIILILGMITSIISISNISISKSWLSKEHSRRLVHIIIGFMTVVSPIIFSKNTIPLIISISFTLINIFSIKYNYFRGIHSTDRVTYGTIYFPISYVIISLFFWRYSEFVIICLSILAFADPFAAYVGSKVNNPINFIIWKDKKTIQGTISFFLFSFFLIFFGVNLMFDFSFYRVIIGAILTSTLATASEATSFEGSDNLTIPVISILSMITFFDQNLSSLAPGYSNYTIFVILFIVQVLLYLFHKLEYLTGDGFIGASIMSIFITLMGSIHHLISMAIFFVLSSILGQLLKKFSYQKVEDTNRNIIQVFANGGIPLVICILGFLYPNQYSFPMFLASISAAMSDTWGTEFGKLSKVKPISIINFKSVDHGTSGGITIIGTLGSIIGASTLGIMTYLITNTRIEIIYYIIICGFLSSLFDSILGDTIQGKYETDIGQYVESKSHNTKLTSGFSYVNNSMVNFLSTIFSSILMLLFLTCYG